MRFETSVYTPCISRRFALRNSIATSCEACSFLLKRAMRLIRKSKGESAGWKREKVEELLLGEYIFFTLPSISLFLTLPTRVGFLTTSVIGLYSINQEGKSRIAPKLRY